MTEIFQRIMGQVPFVLIEITEVDVESNQYKLGVDFGGGLEEKDMEDVILDLANEISAKRDVQICSVLDGEVVSSD